MGITIHIARFDGPVPSLDRIAGEMTRLSGLEISVGNSAPTTDLYASHGELSFSCARLEHVSVYAYTPRPAREPSPMVTDLLLLRDPKVDRLIRDLHAPVHGREVFVQGYVGDEGTLLDIAALALESLGGGLTSPLSLERRRAASDHLDPATLHARHRAHGRSLFHALFMAVGQATSGLARRLWTVIVRGEDESSR